VLEAVLALFLGLEGEQRRQEVGDREARGFPCGKVFDDGVQVGGIVREGGGQAAQRINDAADVQGCLTMVCRVRNGAVLT
jgi:hypothetical protein